MDPTRFNLTSAELVGSCVTCEFFNSLDAVGSRFTKDIYDGIGGDAALFLQAVLVIYIIVFAIRMVGGLADGNSAVRLLWTMFFTAIALFIIRNFATFDQWVLGPLERFGLGYAFAVINLFGGDGKLFVDPTTLSFPGPHSGGQQYAQLVALVEAQATKVINALSALFTQAKFDSGGILVMVGSIIAMLPYIFVLGIFGAFLLESMFAFIAVGIVAPLLLIGLPFPMGRAFATAGFRVLIGAVLTVIFAAGAMGFTIASVDEHADRVGAQIIKANNIEEARAKACSQKTVSETGEVVVQETSDILSCKMFTGQLDDVINTQNKNFIILFFMGWVSILLHLKAKTLASNLSGANDGAGPAAATVAGAKMAMGAGVYAATRLGFGRGGFGTSGESALASLPGGQGIRDHGVLGGMVANSAALVSRMRGETPAGGGGGFNDMVGRPPSLSAPPPSGGGGDLTQLNKNIGDLVKILRTQHATRYGNGE